ncbi:hypothetical protein L596_003174 [Steinernema carpocapsae]|uniref:Uncharacterized protein n=1 Tax=Steinernema carpocapsae TaxID=34508 RepID=A0A4U8UTC6_STECR|nr:hypothetical protein L596_003174 [Steinernema carpocapsae]
MPAHSQSISLLLLLIVFIVATASVTLPRYYIASSLVHWSIHLMRSEKSEKWKLDQQFCYELPIYMRVAAPANSKKICLGMLTLIEPPGTKRVVVEQDFERPNEYALDKVLIGNSDSGDFSEKWKREFSQRPTWCDADMTLQQIQRGKASGHKWALYSRSFIQRCLFWLGCALDKSALWVILVVLGSFLFSCYGLQHVKIETDIVKLWVSKGDRLDTELNYLSAMENKYGKTNWTAADDLHWLREQTDEKLANLAQEKPSEGGYQVVITDQRVRGRKYSDDRWITSAC